MPQPEDMRREPLEPTTNAPQSTANEPPDAAFERALRHAFVRVDAPETLARFLATAAEAEAARRQGGRKLLWFRPRTGGAVLVMPRWAGAAAAAVLLLGSFGTLETLHQRNLHRQAEAQRQFATAEQITDRALEHARQQMRQAGVSLEP